jgi:hypothetical protein
VESEVPLAQPSHNFNIIQGCEYEVLRIIFCNPIFKTSGYIRGTVSADSCLSGNTITPCKARKRRSVSHCLAVIGVHLLSNLPRMSLCKTAKKTWREWIEGGLSHCRIKDEYQRLPYRAENSRVARGNGQASSHRGRRSWSTRTGYRTKLLTFRYSVRTPEGNSTRPRNRLDHGSIRVKRLRDMTRILWIWLGGSHPTVPQEGRGWWALRATGPCIIPSFSDLNNPN